MQTSPGRSGCTLDHLLFVHSWHHHLQEQEAALLHRVEHLLEQKYITVYKCMRNTAHTSCNYNSKDSKQWTYKVSAYVLCKWDMSYVNNVASTQAKINLKFPFSYLFCQNRAMFTSSWTTIGARFSSCNFLDSTKFAKFSSVESNTSTRRQQHHNQHQWPIVHCAIVYAVNVVSASIDYCWPIIISKGFVKYFPH